MPTDYEAAIAAVDEERLLEVERRLSNIEPRVTRLEMLPPRGRSSVWLKIKAWLRGE